MDVNLGDGRPSLAGRRIAFVVSRFPVLSEAFIAYAAAGLIEAGADLSILPVCQPRGDLSQARHAGVGVLAGHDLSRRVIPTRFGAERWRRIAHGPAVIGKAIAQQGPRAVALIDAKLRVPFLAEALSARPDFDILHCQFGETAAPIVRLRKAGGVRGRIVVHFRGHDVTETAVRRGRGRYDLVFARADRFIANCRHFRDCAVALGCPEHLIDVIPTGIDLGAFPQRPDRGPGAPPWTLLSVGRLVEKKGHDVVIDALARLLAQGIDARLRIVGEGSERAALVAQIAARGLGDRVDLLGGLDHLGVSRELARADMFLAASTASRSGDQDAPLNTLKEAMAVGVPVIASRHGGIPELVADGRSGCLVPERDSEALAAAVARLIAAPALAQRMVREARAEIERNWSLARTTALYAECYERALAVPARDGPPAART